MDGCLGFREWWDGEPPGVLPAHVTLKVRKDVPSLRMVGLVREVERSFARASERGSFRLVHYSL